MFSAVLNIISFLHQRTPVYMAAELGHKEIVACLVDNNADINKEDLGKVSIA